MWRTNRSQCAKISPILAVQSQNPLVSTKKPLWEWAKQALPTGNFRKDCGETDMLPSGLNVRYIVLLCSVHSSAMQRLGPYTSHSLLPRRFVFSQCRGKRLVMNRKRPWEGYRLQEKRRLARCLLPAFLCAHIFVERETCGYEAVPVTSEEATGLHDAPSQRGNQHILERQNHKQSKSREGWPTAYGWYFNSDEPEKALPCGEDGLCQGFRAAVVFLASEQVL